MTGPENFEDQFEQEWYEALDGASETPPAMIWNEIDRQLTHQELMLYKTRVGIYRWVAAAVVIIASGLSAMEYFYFHQRDHKYTDYIDVDKPDPLGGFTFRWIDIQEKPEQNLSVMASVSHEDLNSQVEDRTLNTEVSSQYSSPATAMASQTFQEISLANDYEYSLAMMDTYSLQPVSHSAFEPIVATRDVGYMLPVYSNRKVKKSSDDIDEKFFAGLTVGGGSFDPNFQSDGSGLLASSLDSDISGYSLASANSVKSSSPKVSENMLPGGTYSLAFNVGKQLTSKWSLEGGVQYARMETTTETNMVIKTTTWVEVIPATSQVKGNPQLDAAVSKEEVVTYDYQDVDMNNQFQFTSVPVKAGYLLVDGRLKLRLNAGVVTNIYLGNKLTDTDEGVADITIGPGSDSPYREVSFSGIAGLQFGYMFMKNLDIVLEPNYSHSINSLTKDNSSFVANPSSFGVMTGFRYNFH